MVSFVTPESVLESLMNEHIINTSKSILINNCKKFSIYNLKTLLLQFEYLILQYTKHQTFFFSTSFKYSFFNIFIHIF